MVYPKIGDQNQMRLEDLLDLNPVIFRVKAHDLSYQHVGSQLRSPLEKPFLLNNGGGTQTADLMDRTIREDVRSFGPGGLGHDNPPILTKDRRQSSGYSGLPPGPRHCDTQRHGLLVSGQPDPLHYEVGQPGACQNQENGKRGHNLAG